MTTQISVVTTFHPEGYEKYGRRMIETFLQHWPSEVNLKVYAQDCMVAQSASNLSTVNLHQAIPELVEFKKRYSADPRATGQVPMGSPDRKGKQPGIGFRWDAVRFSHKVYAMCHAARSVNQGIMFWMDADMVCHSHISCDFIRSRVPVSAGVAFLGRARKFTETGLWGINLDHSHSRIFIDRMQWAYDDAENGVLAMAEYHDCWVFDRSREWMSLHYPAWQQLDWNQGNIQAEGHPLVNSVWGAYLDHLKGRRKDQGRSKITDLIAPRTEGYWQQ
jgi:hypothetical protein